MSELTLTFWAITIIAGIGSWIGERRLKKLNWKTLQGRQIRWSEPTGRLMAITLAAGATAYLGITGAAASYGWDMYVAAIAEPEAVGQKVRFTQMAVYGITGGLMIGGCWWALARMVTRMVRFRRGNHQQSEEKDAEATGV